MKHGYVLFIYNDFVTVLQDWAGSGKRFYSTLQEVDRIISTFNSFIKEWMQQKKNYPENNSAY
ncbi:hypothetical protein MNV_1380018 [Candidatus Methanoperedens nitroreducens]|uniref:Uncharacterized protein n=1 Tax=Candidatus Methanoperedens nitratireducens TaxID=1392998 RepID=A0A284VKM6_9EURY|nr:hypothetical protein MNV_1380018 [Candidatus Methanoperedens nitroreducens]